MSMIIKSKVSIKGKVSLGQGKGSGPATGATGDTIITDGGVVEIEITDPGSGYANVPDVDITGDGAGATGKAVIKDGSVDSIIITNPGSGYSNAGATIQDPGTASTPLPGNLRTLEECAIVLNSPGDKYTNYFRLQNGWRNFDNFVTLPLNPTITAGTGNCALYPNQDVIVIKVFTGPYSPGTDPGGSDYGYNTNGSGSNYRWGPEPYGFSVDPQDEYPYPDTGASTTHFALDYYNAAGTLLDTVTSVSVNGDTFDGLDVYGHWKAPTSYHYMVFRGIQVTGGDVNFISIQFNADDPNDE